MYEKLWVPGLSVIVIETLLPHVSPAFSMWSMRVLRLTKAKTAANEGLKLLALLSRPTVKAAGRLQKRLVIEDGGHDLEQVQVYFPPLVLLASFPLTFVRFSHTPSLAVIA